MGQRARSAAYKAMWRDTGKKKRPKKKRAVMRDAGAAKFVFR